MTLPPEQRTAYLEALRNDPKLGDVPALRSVGVQGTSGELRRIVRDDPDLHEDAWVARGWEVLPAISALATVATDTEHRAWNQANERWLKLRGFRDPQQVELTGADGGPLAIEDRSASLNDVARVLTAAGALNRSPDDQEPVAAAGEPVAAPRDV